MNKPVSTNRTYQGNRIEWTLDQPFETTLEKLTRQLRSASPALLVFYLKIGGKERLKSYLSRIAGELGLMIVGTVRHGLLMSALGGPRRAQMFLIGNPLIALSLMTVWKQAGVYAPLRVMVSDDAERTIITYDDPRSVFGQFEEPIFTATGALLHAKLESLISRIGAPR